MRRFVRSRPGLKEAWYRLSARYWRVRSLGRIHGDAFRIIRPERVVISRGGHISMGRGVVIDSRARLIVHGHLQLGDRVYVGRDAVISMVSDVRIGAGTRFGERASIHERDYAAAGDWDPSHSLAAPIHIGSRCWFGANTVVTSGVAIGDDVTVGAQSVVTRDLPDGVTAVGAPAKVVERV
jgi:maltose O-acetyltransferase